MNRNLRLTLVGSSLLAVSFIASLASPQDAGKQPGMQGKDMPLPPGITEADMQACMEAGTPGPEQEKLARAAGTWKGKSTMWMGPDAPPSETEATVTITPLMDGRYIQCEYKSDMPGMGPFHGVGVKAFDKVGQTYQATWIDNHSTGIMIGAGASSGDGSMTWHYTYNCPITKKAATMREVERFTGDDTMSTVMYAEDPKSGREYKMMETTFTRQGSAKSAAGSR
jgi:hypothetical protein